MTFEHVFSRRNGTLAGAAFPDLPYRTLQPNGVPDILTEGSGAVTHDGSSSLYGVGDGTASAGVVVAHPRSFSWGGGRLAYRVVARTVGEQSGRRAEFGFSDGDRVALFVIVNGELRVQYGQTSVSGSSTELTRTAGFSRRLPFFNPALIHEYEIVIGLDGAIAWCVDGVEVYSTRNDNTLLALRPFMHTGITYYNVSATSGAASLQVFDELWTSESRPRKTYQTALLYFPAPTGTKVACIGIDPASPYPRTARLRAARGTSSGPEASVDLFMSKVPPVDPLVVVEAGHPLAAVADTAGMNAMTFSDGEKINDHKLFLASNTSGVLNFEDDDAPELVFPVYAATGRTMPTPEPLYLYAVIQVISGSGRTIGELRFEIE